MKTYEIVVPIEEAAEYLKSDNCSFMLASYDVEEVFEE